MSSTFRVAEILVQLFQQICSFAELEVKRDYQNRSIMLTRSNNDVRHDFSFVVDNEGGIGDIMVNARWRNDRGGSSETYFQGDFGCLAVLKRGLSIFGNLYIQCIITKVSGSTLSVDISVSKKSDSQYRKIATILIDQVKDQLTNIEPNPLNCMFLVHTKATCS